MTFETNGTQMLRSNFIDWVKEIDTEIFFSCSPNCLQYLEKKAKAQSPKLLQNIETSLQRTT